MTDIDWLAVWTVLTGTAVKLTQAERKMVMRRLEERMLRPGESGWRTNKLSASEVARRLGITERSVCRYLAELRAAEKSQCPVCRQDMWTYPDGWVEPHPDALLRECPMSSRPKMRGLAAVRPDLYGWVEELQEIS